jgi:hypothetical protein
MSVIVAPSAPSQDVRDGVVRSAAVAPRPLLLALVLVATLALAGCGREDRNSVIEKGDDICEQANDSLADLGEPESLSGYPGYARRARPIVDEAVKDLKALDPPPEDKEAFDKFIGKSEELSRVLRELEAAGPRATGEEIQGFLDEIQEITGDSNEAAADYGFRDCAEE